VAELGECGVEFQAGRLVGCQSVLKGAGGVMTRCEAKDVPFGNSL
jgi:hypothetical protein